MQRWAFRGYRALGALCVGAALLAGCATPQRISSQGGEPTFDRTGRFALTVDQRNDKHEAVQGGFAWQDSGDVLLLDLANPLGNTLARVTVRPGRAVLERSDGSTEIAAGPDALVEQVLGSPIPVAGLRHWLKGQTGPDAGQLQADGQGRPTHFVQDGWQATLSRYDDQGPRLLQLRRRDAQRDVSVRLVVDSE